MRVFTLLLTVVALASNSVFADDAPSIVDAMKAVKEPYWRSANPEHRGIGWYAVQEALDGASPIRVRYPMNEQEARRVRVAELEKLELREQQLLRYIGSFYSTHPEAIGDAGRDHRGPLDKAVFDLNHKVRPAIDKAKYSPLLPITQDIVIPTGTPAERASAQNILREAASRPGAQVAVLDAHDIKAFEAARARFIANQTIRGAVIGAAVIGGVFTAVHLAELYFGANSAPAPAAAPASNPNVVIVPQPTTGLR